MQVNTDTELLYVECFVCKVFRKGFVAPKQRYGQHTGRSKVMPVFSQITKYDLPPLHCILLVALVLKEIIIMLNNYYELSLIFL